MRLVAGDVGLAPATGLDEPAHEVLEAVADRLGNDRKCDGLGLGRRAGLEQAALVGEQLPRERLQRVVTAVDALVVERTAGEADAHLDRLREHDAAPVRDLVAADRELRAVVAVCVGADGLDAGPVGRIGGGRDEQRRESGESAAARRHRFGRSSTADSSRWRSSTGRDARKWAAIDSARYTERCRPPVQPIAIVR